MGYRLYCRGSCGSDLNEWRQAGAIVGDLGDAGDLDSTCLIERAQLPQAPACCDHAVFPGPVILKENSKSVLYILNIGNCWFFFFLNIES